MRITGLGSYLPKDLVDNESLTPLDPPMSVAEMDRLGVRTRGIASDDEGVAEMAVVAAKRALERAGTAAESLDFVILANWSERRFVPDFAPRIQARLGARRAFAFDVGCACSGFVYGLSIAHGFLGNERIRRGLVVASDRSTRRIRPRSRGTLLFGDGAAAALVERGARTGIRMVDYELSTDGSRNGLADVAEDGYLRSHIKQRELNELAVTSLIEVGQRLLARRHLELGDVDFVVPHSGTAGIQAMLAKRLKTDASKILTNLPEVGNLTTASIPSALDQFLHAGVLTPGHRVLSLAVGLGWHAVALLLEL
jgi:3-oxoacyl-[acyl-carrier-protein] synthase-3